MAKKADLVTKTVFDQGTAAAAQMIRSNAGKGLTADQFVMSKDAIVTITRPYVASGEDVMNKGLEETVNPALIDIEKLHAEVKNAIAAANDDKGTHTCEETGFTYGIKAAYDQVAGDQAVIKGDEDAGLTHHVRVSHWLDVAGEVLPFLEIVGLLAWLTFLWNVNILHPTAGGGLLVWVLTVVLVLLVAIAVAFAAKTAGVAHNQAREARVEGKMSAAEPLFNKRNWMLGLCAFLGVVLSATLIIRGLQALEDPAWYTSATIIAVSLIAGFAMPGLAYAAKAMDGSLHSRRADELTAWGTEVARVQVENKQKAQSLVSQAKDLDAIVVNISLPRVIADTVSEVCQAIRPYEWGYIQVGASGISLPAYPEITATNDKGQVHLVKSFSCGLDGAPSLDTGPARTAMGHVVTLRHQREDLERDIDSIELVKFAHVA
jgi:hypothetical protein